MSELVQFNYFFKENESWAFEKIHSGAKRGNIFQKTLCNDKELLYFYYKY